MKKTGVLDQVLDALKAWTYWNLAVLNQTRLMKRCERRETGSRTESDFPAGGWRRSVLDGTKFIAAAANYPENIIRGTFCKRAAKRLKAPSRWACADAASNRFRIQRRRGDLP